VGRCGAVLRSFVGGVYSLFTMGAGRVLRAVSGAVGTGRGTPPGGGFTPPAAGAGSWLNTPEKQKGVHEKVLTLKRVYATLFTGGNEHETE